MSDSFTQNFVMQKKHPGQSMVEYGFVLISVTFTMFLVLGCFH